MLWNSFVLSFFFYCWKQHEMRSKAACVLTILEFLRPIVKTTIRNKSLTPTYLAPTFPMHACASPALYSNHKPTGNLHQPLTIKIKCTYTHMCGERKLMNIYGFWRVITAKPRSFHRRHFVWWMVINQLWSPPSPYRWPGIKLLSIFN